MICTGPRRRNASFALLQGSSFCCIVERETLGPGLFQCFVHLDASFEDRYHSFEGSDSVAIVLYDFPGSLFTNLQPLCRKVGEHVRRFVRDGPGYGSSFFEVLRRGMTFHFKSCAAQPPSLHYLVGSVPKLTCRRFPCNSGVAQLREGACIVHCNGDVPSSSCELDCRQ